MIQRKNTKRVYIGDVPVGRGAPVSIQSMSNIPTFETGRVLEQAAELEKAGCNILRLSVPDRRSVSGFREIKRSCNMPLVADIHFNYRYALEAIDAGADKIRINPGNIGSNQRVREVVRAADSAGIPIRVGVNSGSVDKEILEKYQGPTPQALAESAMEYVKLMKEFEFDNTVISIKASDVMTTVEACRIFSEHSDIPQHIGITESGTVKSGSIRSSVGLGILLSEGIGDTLRVSLSGDPVEEIHTAREILASLNLIQKPVVIACPTCGRTRVDVPALAQEVEKYLSGVSLPIKVAVMGCIVNGPGEAKEADIGVACAPDRGMIFSKGERIESVPADMLLERLKFYIEDRIKSGNS